MATTRHAVIPAAVSAVDSVSLDVELSRRAAALLTVIQPRKDSERVVQELLKQLGAEKLTREARGLNHWSAHAPKFLSGIVRLARQEKRRRYQEAEAFYKARHREIVRFARVIVQDDSGAEAVASDTYRELLEGAATFPGFFAALVCNARDYMEGEAYRRGKFVSRDEALAPTFGGAETLDEGGRETSSFEPTSNRLEDQDPLDILIARDEEAARQRMVSRAKEDPRWRYIKKRDWAAALLGNVRN
jgi:hypothetical protein